MNKLRIWWPALAGIVAIFILLWLFRSLAQFLTYNLFWILPGLQFLFSGALFIVHLPFAQGVMRDAAAQESHGRKTFFVAPEVWGLATVIGGFFMVIVYWVFHHSTLRRS